MWDICFPTTLEILISPLLTVRVGGRVQIRLSTPDLLNLILLVLVYHVLYLFSVLLHVFLWRVFSLISPNSPTSVIPLESATTYPHLKYVRSLMLLILYQKLHLFPVSWMFFTFLHDCILFYCPKTACVLFPAVSTALSSTNLCLYRQLFLVF